ncbi:MAG: hypothetical protein Q4C66_11095 [Lachnospiraceae bacterium]|nr:hypothetical protein [Lachnospiraceae bacterium]
MIKKTSLILLVYFLVCTNFFMAGPYIADIYYLDWIILEMLALCAFFSLRGIPRSLREETKNFELCILWFIVLNLLQVVYTYLKYRQPLMTGVKMVYFSFAMLIYFLLERLVNTKERTDDLKQHLVLFVVLCNIGTLLKYFLLGRRSCPHFYLILLCLPISISYILYKKNTRLGWAALVSSIFVRIFLSSNMAFLIILVAVASVQVYMYFYDKYLSKKNKVLAIFLLVVVVGILGVLGIIQYYVKSMIYLDIGTRMRVLTIEYFANILKRAPLFGVGTLDPSYSAEFYNFIHGGLNQFGGTGQFYLEDIGIIGTVCQYGLLSLIPIFFMIKGMIISIKNIGNINRHQNIGIFVLILGMFISLSPFNKAPIQVLPLVFLISSNNMIYQE